jgi:hypothetical protein
MVIQLQQISLPEPQRVVMKEIQNMIFSSNNMIILEINLMVLKIQYSKHYSNSMDKIDLTNVKDNISTTSNHGNASPIHHQTVLMYTALPSTPKNTNLQAHAISHVSIMQHYQSTLVV